MNNENNNSVESLQQVVALLSEAYIVAGNATNDEDKKSQFKKSALEIEELIRQIPTDFQASAKYHCALLYTLCGDTAPAKIILLDISKHASAMPEVYWLLIQLDTSSNSNFRWQMETILGELLPLSVWGKMIDAKLEGNEVIKTGGTMSRSEWPSVPDIENKKLFMVATLFDNMGLCKEAANAYREAIYCLAPPKLPEFGEESWISNNTAACWLSIARNEALIGYKYWAFQAVLMAVVSSPKTIPAALSIVKQLETPPDPDLKPSPDLDKFNKIALLYKECSLHTRGIEALSLAELLLKIDLANEKKNIANEWKKLLEEYSVGRKETCFLFGYKVSQAKAEELVPEKFPYGYFEQLNK